MADVHFEIVTPEKLARSDDAFMIVVPGTEGDFGVLAGHAPMMSVIRDGEIVIYSNPTTVTSRIKVQGGFAEVKDKGLTILAEHVEEQA